MGNRALLSFGPNLPKKGNLGSKFLKSGTEFVISTLKLVTVPIFIVTALVVLEI